jgi:hypothetical protein
LTLLFFDSWRIALLSSTHKYLLVLYAESEWPDDRYGTYGKKEYFETCEYELGDSQRIQEDIGRFSFDYPHGTVNLFVISCVPKPEDVHWNNVYEEHEFTEDQLKAMAERESIFKNAKVHADFLKSEHELKKKEDQIKKQQQQNELEDRQARDTYELLKKRFES